MNRKRGIESVLAVITAIVGAGITVLPPLVTEAFSGVNLVQEFAAQIALVFFGVGLSGLAVLSGARWLVVVRTPRLRISRATAYLHAVRSLIVVLTALGLTASAYALTQQEVSLGYVAMFGAMSGVATPSIMVLATTLKPPRPPLRAVALGLAPAGIASLSTAIGFGFDPRMLVNPWIWMLILTSLVGGSLPFVQGELGKREAEEFKSDPPTMWDHLLVAAKISAWFGFGVSGFFTVLALMWGPSLEFDPDLRSGMALAILTLLYVVSAYTWHLANTIGDKSVNGIVLVLGVPISFLISPWVNDIHLTHTQIAQQAIATVGIFVAVSVQTTISRR